MSVDEPRIDPEQCGGNAAPYVLGALTEAEHESFRTHLERCAVCREEVAALQVVAAAKNYISRRNVEGVKTTEMGLSDDIYHEPTDPVWKDAWNVTDALIVEMGDEIKARGAQFLVVTLSSSIQVQRFRNVR